ncbi:MAG: alpha/beta fold hydrolase [Actinobacteria bacterium]|nr:alpha/beta fold hydrolase [Actinomycetota bacterium]
MIDFAQWKAGSLEIWREGDGPTVGYLHGMVCAPGRQSFVPELASRGFRVIAPSLPGYARTSPSVDIRNIHDWVFALSEIIDAAGLVGAPLVASSTGAMLALELAAMRPEAFSSLVLVAPLGLWSDDRPVADPFSTTLSGQRALLTRDPTATASFFDDSAAGDLLVDATIQRYTARTATASLVWPIPEFGLAERMHRVSCPVTLVWGSDDQIVDPSYAEEFAARLRDVRGRHVVDGAGHLVEWDDPRAVASLAAAAFG